MDVKSIILGLLHYREMSGYDIKQFFTSSIGFFYDASYGAIYPALKKLEQEGHVTKEEVLQSGKPNKIMYGLTQQGRDQFHQELKTEIEGPIVRSDMLTRLFFCDLHTAEDQKHFFDDLIAYQEKRQEIIRNSYQKSMQDLNEYQKMCWEYTLHQLDGAIQFLKGKKQMMDKGQNVAHIS
ncbi:PadR family transcriptional regulator [Brevibacillus sp. 7WMA2]|uniref:Transcriptional regulator n=1 Tax=Brevibacillus laterosporus LMG 15441 TaxID=1042163 RepID=A0A075RG03_BRELA|nr:MULTISPECIES: PadR family transcriptional regulator [Brevibacillus]HAS01867.1 PadR family transcriptional regulator [Brevibacillus sp.]AIG28200.1 transcriptional regulator [Brevibacillus laterosporus LMG 15441]AUM66575.1 PadR family transcriptional regulator [Brevibacillus laterosporus]AYK05445.1 PadR family transcriptional regulator [Brevibacillus laterosporus]ERM17240.1 transcriptional regulator [Brevibacillus laterosporus PE36]